MLTVIGDSAQQMGRVPPHPPIGSPSRAGKGDATEPVNMNALVEKG